MAEGPKDWLMIGLCFPNARIVAVLLAALMAPPCHAATLGIATTPALCANEGPGLGLGTDCFALTGGTLLASGPMTGTTAMAAPDRRMAPQPDIDGLINLHGGLAKTANDAMTVVVLHEVSRLGGEARSGRGGLLAGWLASSQLSLFDMTRAGAEVSASDLVVPGAAASRFLFWKSGCCELVRWSGWWRVILAPVMVKDKPAEARQPKPARRRISGPIAPLVTPVRSPLWLATIPSDRRLRGSAGIGQAPAPVPLPGAGFCFVAALGALRVLRRR